MKNLFSPKAMCDRKYKLGIDGFYIKQKQRNLFQVIVSAHIMMKCRFQLYMKACQLHVINDTFYIQY